MDELSKSFQAEKYCSIRKVNHLRSFEAKDIFYDKLIGLRCDIKNSDFTLSSESYRIIKNKSYPIKDKYSSKIEFNWPSEIKASSSLTKKFNLDNFMRLFTNFKYYVSVYFHNLHSVDLDLFNEPTYSIEAIYLMNSDLRFTIDGKPIKSCADISIPRSGIFNIHSMFQIPLEDGRKFYIFGCRFPLTLCPLVFYGSNIVNLRILNLADTFYKQNLLKFSNDSIYDNLNSTILFLNIYRCENIVLDTTFINPAVFKALTSLCIHCPLKSISVQLFPKLKKLLTIQIESVYFRKFINTNGIEWIKAINRGLHVNLSNSIDFISNYLRIRYIDLNIQKGDYIEPMWRVFPDEDFCIYKDYPFDQMVFTRQYCYSCKNNKSFDYLRIINPFFSCNYLWINHYQHLLRYVFRKESPAKSNLYFLINSDSYKNRNSCDFKKRLALCNRSDYHLKDIWGPLEYLILNKKIQIGVKILIYIVSLFSIATNILVIRIMFAKHNKHVFKDFKHYTYLGLISVFSLSISIIEIFSWLSECFYPFEVFCLGVHKIVVAQLFKMVFKECFVIALRFLSNFCYIAFALCRISLIGRDHNKLIKFMSVLKIWKYVMFSLIFSLAFSWIKYFKYSINFEFGELNYPIWNERDIATLASTLPPILDFYMIFNVISDLLNYLVFVVVCFVVDLSMLIRLRSTMNESIEKIKSMGSDEKQFEKKKREMDEAMKKSIRMVVVNTSIGLLFKLPLVFLPLLNAIGKFYYKNTRYRNQTFDHFYTQLFETDFNSLIQDSTELLYLISISIQFFIYKTYDKKFKEGTISPPPPTNKNSPK